MNDPVLEFEKKFASKIGADYAIAVNSGTSALHAALESIDVRHGEVIVSSLAPAVVTFAIIHAGAWPVFADVDPDSQLVTHESIGTLMGSRTKAILAVNLHGLPCDIDKIRQNCRRNGTEHIPIIEDCAQSLLARYKDVFAGTKADFGCFSFEKKKHLTTGSEGGMIVTQSSAFAARARKFAGLGYKHMEANGGSTRVPDFSPNYERFSTIGCNYRLSYAQAEIGLEKLKTIQDAIWTRQENGYLWQNALGCQLQPHIHDADNVFYSAAYPFPEATDWNRFYQMFKDAGGDGFYGMPKIAYDEPALADYKGLHRCPVAEDLQKRLILLKTHYTLEECKRQADILAGVLHGKVNERAFG